MATATKGQTQKEGTPYYFDQAAVDRVISFCEHLRQSKGQWAGKYLKLLPWQTELITNVFGWKKKTDGTRRYRTIYIEIPKKSGKSSLTAALSLYLLVDDGEMGAEVYAAAADKYQASIVFDQSAQMVLQSPALSKRLKVRDSVKRIIYQSTNSYFRALSAEVHTKHGLNPSAVIIDELHAHPSRDLYDVLTSGSGASRKQPLFIIITTAGYDRNSICYELHKRARAIETGIVKPEEDPTFYGAVYGPPDDDPDWDWADEKNWAAVNPSLGFTITLDDLRDQFKQAQSRIEEENLFRQLRLNQWTNQSVRWIKLKDWDKCVGTVKLDELKGRECYSALDLSSSNDLTALAHVFPFEDSIYKVLMRFWIPEEVAAEKEKRDRVPYTRWIKQGLVQTTPGNRIDYGFIKQQLLDDRMQFNMRELAYDPWGAVKIYTDLQEEGFVTDQKLQQDGHPLLVEFRQGYKSMSPPSKELINIILSCKLEHGNNPVLRWNADNAVIEMDPAGNIKPDKAKATQRIDGLVSLIMALGRAMLHPLDEGKSIYETEDVKVF